MSSSDGTPSTPRDPASGSLTADRSRASTRFDNGLRYRDANHPAQWQFTPSYILEPVRHDLAVASLLPSYRTAGIWLDPCTTSDNPVGARHFYTAEDDGLAFPWFSEVGHIRAQTIFCNPPYGKAREPWVDRCIEAADRGQPVVLLVPAATDTRIFQRAVDAATAVVFIRGRVKFGTLRENRRQHAASHPSALIGFRTALRSCIPLGLRMVNG